jgi:Mg2+-importing ATPase
VLLTTTAILVVGSVIPFTVFGAHIGLRALPQTYFAWLAATLFAYGLLKQLVKRACIRRFGTWL